MKLFENAPSNYEEIKTWYPVWYRNVLEMDALWRVWGKHLDEVQAAIVRSVDNNFLDFADDETITKLERFLSIVYDGPRTLQERRNVIKAFVLGHGHIGQRQIKDLVAVIADGEINVELIGGTIQITVTEENTSSFNLKDCHLVLDRRIPAHLDLSFTSIVTVEFGTDVYIGAMPTNTSDEFDLVIKPPDGDFDLGGVFWLGGGLSAAFAAFGLGTPDFRESWDIAGNAHVGGAATSVYAGFDLDPPESIANGWEMDGAIAEIGGMTSMQTTFSLITETQRS